jgi:hypothetical protein
MALPQKPFLDEPAFEPDNKHCFGCGVEEIAMQDIKDGKPKTLKYRSMYPLKMLYVSHDDRGQIDQMKGTNGDYNVCAPCYKAQWEEQHGEGTCPV